MALQPPDFHPAPGQCPICAAAADPAGPHRPFCSDRCKWIDLGRWFTGTYRVASPTPPSEDDEEHARGQLA